jgi:signal transduction histidine kinase
MRLADYILANREPILREWEEFARTCAPASGTMDVEALRDHANQMLTVIAADLRTPQDRLEQSEKSKGRARPEDPEATTAAEQHGAGRAESGFSVEQMVAEYRALRASVIRLWTKEKGELVPADVEDLALSNLVSNAVQHGIEGATVHIEIAGGDEQVAIAVRNRGVVIPPEEIDGIFNPMKGRTSPHKVASGGPTDGLGLGLYIVERIVSAHEGHIAVASSESSGTTFTVYLPRHQTSSAHR